MLVTYNFPLHFFLVFFSFNTHFDCLPTRDMGRAIHGTAFSIFKQQWYSTRLKSLILQGHQNAYSKSKSLIHASKSCQFVSRIEIQTRKNATENVVLCNKLGYDTSTARFGFGSVNWNVQLKHQTIIYGIFNAE